MTEAQPSYSKPVIIGAGLAGLTVALSLAPMRVILLSPRKLGDECASGWAQGGVAAAIGKDDNAALHAADTLKAGAGLCDPAIAKTVTEDGARVIEDLLAKGVPFDRDAMGQIRLGLEAAHSRRRIVHATDQTGAAIMKALIAVARTTPSIEIIEDAVATELLAKDGSLTGVIIERGGVASLFPAQQVVLATGGAGALWRTTSNPLGSWGRGLLLAAKVGAVLGDLEFMQFHPTCIDIGRDPMPLASEALRGEGCTLIDDNGERFIDELQPRDIVARAIWRKIADRHRVFLDARTALGEKFAARFPSIHAVCISAGIDPAEMPIPVSPGAHYHMGGIMTDAEGRTNIEGLWACGEVTCTGLHGANRLASNSLLEAASFGRRVAASITSFPRKQESNESDSEQMSQLAPRHASLDSRFGGNDAVEEVRSTMSRHVGVLRDAAGLQAAVRSLAPLAVKSDMALLGLMVAASALKREESRGSHARSDFPDTNSAWQHHQTITLADIQQLKSPSRSYGTG